MTTIFMRSYLQAAGKAPFLPASREDLKELLFLYYLEKVIFELGQDLAHGPEGAGIPLKGILRALEARG